MKKNTKKILKLMIAIIAIPTIIVGISKLGNYKSMDKKGQMALFDAEAYIKSEEFQESFEKVLKDTYGENYKAIIDSNNDSVLSAQKIEEILKKDESKAIYDDYFGGMYINDDNQLIIQVVKNSVPNKMTEAYTTYNSAINLDDNSKIEYVENSYNILKSLDTEITNYFKNEGDSAIHNIGIISNYVDVVTNKVVVELENNTKEKQAEFKKKVSDSTLITFKQGKREFTTSYNPGQALNKTNGELFCTLGFRAKRNGKAGFVTAGHCQQGIGLNKSYQGYGTLRARSISGKADAAFIETSTTVTNTLSNSIYPVTSLQSKDLAVPYTVGSIVAKAGAKTKGTSGKITVASYTAYIFNQYDASVMVIEDAVKADLVCDEGDSGAPVFTLEKTARLYGVISATTKTNETTFSKMSNIKSALSVTRY